MLTGVLDNIVSNLQDALDATIIGRTDDKKTSKNADFSIVSSTMIPVKEDVLKKVLNALAIV